MPDRKRRRPAGSPASTGGQFARRGTGEAGDIELHDTSDTATVPTRQRPVTEADVERLAEAVRRLGSDSIDLNSPAPVALRRALARVHRPDGWVVTVTDPSPSVRQEAFDDPGLPAEVYVRLVEEDETVLARAALWPH